MNTITHTLNTNSVFTTKEEYVAFRAKWKQLHADGYHKPQRFDYEGGSVWDSAYKKYVQVPGGHHMTSRLSVWHHLVFNIAIGRSPEKAFSKVAENRDGYGKTYLWHALNYTPNVKHDFMPFGDTLTPEQQSKILALIKDFKATL